MSKQRRKIVNESTYQSTLSSIIQRDYFPDLAELEKQAAIADRRAVGDFRGAVEVRRAARAIQEHEELEQEIEEEQEEAAKQAGVRPSARPLHRETLTGFHARVTSEDNTEFEQAQRQEVAEQRKQREQVFLLTNGPAKASQRPAYAESPLLLASDQFTAQAHRPTANTKASATNSLFFVPVAQQKTSQEQHLMLPPPPKPGMVLTTTTSHTTSLAKNALIEYLPKNRDKKIEPSATRFPRQLVVHQPRAHLEGSESSTAADSSTDDDAWTDLDETDSHVSLSKHMQQGIKRKRKERESYVQMTPLIVPGNESPLVTWGSVNATPLAITKASDEGAFRLPQESERDAAALRAQKVLEERARRASATPSRSKLARGKGPLSSVARSLLKRPESARSSNAFASALRSSYSRSQSDSIRRRESLEQRTPRILPQGGAAAPSSASNRKNMTDGLLKLPK